MTSLYDQVNEGRRWKAPLHTLLPELRKQAWAELDRPHGPPELDDNFAWVVLPKSALVALRIRPDLGMRAELRLARTEPLTEASRPKWEQEVAVFLAHFDLKELNGNTPCTEPGQSRQYVRHVEARDAGKTAARFMQLRLGEVVVGRGLCCHCGAYVPWESPFGLAQACSSCAVKVRPLARSKGQ